jgi:hypothetical protein
MSLDFIYMEYSFGLGTMSELLGRNISEANAQSCHCLKGKRSYNCHFWFCRHFIPEEKGGKVCYTYPLACLFLRHYDVPLMTQLDSTRERNNDSIQRRISPALQHHVAVSGCHIRRINPIVA